MWKSMLKNVCIFIIFSVSVKLNYVNCRSTPCPGIFEYKSNGQTKHGIITIPAPSEGKTVVDAIIDIQGDIYNKYTGSLKLLKDLASAVDDAIEGKDIQYILTYPISQQEPYITNIMLNNKIICSGSEVIDTEHFTYQHSLKYPKGSNVWSTSRNLHDSTLPLQPGCMMDINSDNQSKMIIGKNVTNWEYPWLVALFHINRNGARRIVSFKCGSNLITNSYVVTAAHCVSGQKQVLLEFGKYDLSKFEEDNVYRMSIKIIIHSEAQPKEAHADIALISFYPVNFTPRIVPICLWPYSDPVPNGIIAGWGQKNQGGSPNVKLSQLEMNSTDLNRCKASNKLLSKLASNETFCAVSVDKYSGPCHGDSGSSYFIKHGNEWYLRGIVSTSLTIKNTNICLVNNYSLFVDIVGYQDWIRINL